MAEQYLRENAAVLGLQSAELSDLVHKVTRESLSGVTVRYNQFADGIPVYKGEVVVHINNDNRVSMVTANYRPSLALDNLVPAITADQGPPTGSRPSQRHRRLLLRPHRPDHLRL
jgi:Zn-dependent metalloprotease